MNSFLIPKAVHGNSSKNWHACHTILSLRTLIRDHAPCRTERSSPNSKTFTPMPSGGRFTAAMGSGIWQRMFCKTPT